MNKYGAIKSHRSKKLMLALSAGLTAVAMVANSKAQPANNPPAANVTTPARNNAVNDLITDGLTDGRIDRRVTRHDFEF